VLLTIRSPDSAGKEHRWPVLMWRVVGRAVDDRWQLGSGEQST